VHAEPCRQDDEVDLPPVSDDSQAMDVHILPSLPAMGSVRALWQPPQDFLTPHVIFDRSGLFVSVSPAYCQLLQMDEAAGQTLVGKHSSAVCFARAELQQRHLKQHLGQGSSLINDAIFLFTSKSTLSSGASCPLYAQPEGQPELLADIIRGEKPSFTPVWSITVRIGSSASASRPAQSDTAVALYGLWWQHDAVLKQHVISVRFLQDVPADMAGATIYRL
jgi:hypothetical protein